MRAALAGALPLWVACAAVALAQAPDGDLTAQGGAGPTFGIREYRVKGNMLLKPLVVEQAVYPFLGPNKSLAAVEEARAALERAYHQAGYLSVLVYIPEQEVKNGVVRLRVTEGRIGQLDVTGNRYYSRGQIRAAVPALAPGTVPNFPEVEKQLAALARTPDRKVTPTLRPGVQPGTVDAELAVEDRLPLHGAVELNNRNSLNTEPLRAQASVRYDNLWQRGHSISALVQTAPQDTAQSQVYALTYALPLGTSGNTLAFYGVRSKSNVAAVGDATVIGNGYIVGTRAVFPLPGVGRYAHNFTAGLDYKDFRDELDIAGQIFEIPVSYTPLLLQYGAAYGTDRSTTQGSIGLNFAPRGVWVNDNTQFENKRFRAQLSYVYLRGVVEHERALWPKTKLGLRLTGQIADQPLISNEQFAAGGADSVRGYYEAQLLGDNGLQGSIQLSSRLAGSADGTLNELVAFGFVDGAALWIMDAVGQEPYYDIASAGVGLSLRAWQHFNALLDLAVPLVDTADVERGDARVLFRVAYEF